MGWPEAVHYGFEVVLLLGLAWIGGRQQQVKRDLREFNGTIVSKVDAVPAVIQAGLHAQTGQLAEKVEAVPDAVLEAAIRRGVEIEVARARGQK